MTAVLRGYTFQPKGSIYIHAAASAASTTCSATATEKRSGEEKSSTAWLPTAARFDLISVTFGIPLLAIAALEALFHYSTHNQGIADVAGSEDIAIRLSRTLSALAMFCIASCYNSVDFTISSFAPFSLLRSGRAAIEFQTLGSLPPVALWRSIHRRHYPAVFFRVSCHHRQCPHHSSVWSMACRSEHCDPSSGHCVTYGLLERDLGQ